MHAHTYTPYQSIWCRHANSGWDNQGSTTGGRHEFSRQSEYGSNVHQPDLFSTDVNSRLYVGMYHSTCCHALWYFITPSTLFCNQSNVENDFWLTRELSFVATVQLLLTQMHFIVKAKCHILKVVYVKLWKVASVAWQCTEGYCGPYVLMGGSACHLPNALAEGPTSGSQQPKPFHWRGWFAV